MTINENRLTGIGLLYAAMRKGRQFGRANSAGAILFLLFARRFDICVTLSFISHKPMTIFYK